MEATTPEPSLDPEDRSSDPDAPASEPSIAAVAEPQTRAERHHRSFWKELPVLIVVAFAIALLIKTLAVQAFYIPSGSMIPTLRVGDRILVEKIGYRFGDPGRGDVVVFEKDLGTRPVAEPGDGFIDDIGDAFRSLFGFPTGGEQDFVKRVMAVGGDTIEGRDGRVFVNGDPVKESFLPDGTKTSAFPAQKVPEGQIFVMGDNRSNSDDSRNFGPVPVDEVVGRAFLLIWPPRDAGAL
ncbi:MAG: signal peptidase I [Actinomycetota bacterium]